jgi:hypothetical protein
MRFAELIPFLAAHNSHCKSLLSKLFGFYAQRSRVSEMKEKYEDANNCLGHDSPHFVPSSSFLKFHFVFFCCASSCV